MSRKLILTFTFFLFAFSFVIAQWSTTVDSALFVDHGLYPYLAIDKQEESIIVIYIANANQLKAKKYDRYGYPLWGGQAVTLVDTVEAFGVDLSNLSNQWGAVISDDSGGAIVCWQDFRHTTYDPYPVPQNNEIYIQRVDINGQIRYGMNGKRISTPASAGWHTLGDMKRDYHGGFVVGFNNDSTNTLSVLKRFGINGESIWERYFDGLFMDIPTIDQTGNIFVNSNPASPGRRHKLDLSGNSLWPDTLNGIIPGSIAYRHGGAFPDKSGGVIGVGLGGELKINRVDSAGQYVFGPNGIDLGQGQQYRIGYASDGTAGIYVSWAAVGGTKIQRISSNGDTVFSFPGINISPDSLPFGSEPYLIHDDNHGVWGIWADSRHNPQKAFYTQRMDSSGNKIFPDSALAFHITVGNTLFARPARPIISDLRGGFIFTWNEQQPGFGVRVFLKQISRNGNLGEIVPAIEPAQGGLPLPQKIELKSIYPNPFNNSTTIEFHLNKAALVKVKIYDVLGKQINSLIEEYLSPNSYRVEWDGTDHAGRGVSSGIYFCRLSSGGQSIITRKILFIQ